MRVAADEVVEIASLMSPDLEYDNDDDTYPFGSRAPPVHVPPVRATIGIL